MSAFKSGLSDRSIGEERRKLFGTGPCHIEAEPYKAPVEKWYCEAGGCTQWRDTDGVYKGTCIGYCSGC